MKQFKVIGVDHLVLRVSDLDASLRFYNGLLGCELERELKDIGLYQLRAGQQLIDLVPIGTKLGGDSPVEQENRNQDHFCLVIEAFDPETIRQEIEQAGYTCSEPAERYGASGYGQSVYITDPDGNTVELKASNRE